MKIFEYKDYGQYKRAQENANKAKLDLCGIRAEVIRQIAERVLALNMQPTFGLCHGTRRGEEQKIFNQCLACPVIGTEISSTADQFPNTIQWDFHDVRPEWIAACDLVYTNSLDHAKNPSRALSSWLSCLKVTTGVLAIEWTESQKKGPKESTISDPFSATTSEVVQLIEEAGGSIMEIMRADGKGHKIVVIYARRLN